MGRIDFDALRAAMVDHPIARRGLRSRRVLAAMRAVPREAFVPEHLQHLAYEDRPLPIADAQTISQPYIVALMIDALALQRGDRVLEIGTGSGYAAAVLSRIAAQVYTVERIERLATLAARTLARLGCLNVHGLHADGTLGWPEHAPYAGIAVAAGGPVVPQALREQLGIGGRLVMPLGPDRSQQTLVLVTRVSEHEYTTDAITEVCFVPLLGEQGWMP